MSSKEFRLRFFTAISAVFVLFLMLQEPTLSAAAGSISGKVVDAQSGDPLPGVNVIIEGTTMGAATDVEGAYRIVSVPEGNYTVVASMIGYGKLRVENVKVETGAAVPLNFSMNVETLAGQEVVVQAEALKNTEASLLRERKLSMAVSDAISAEAISRAGVSNAADAMTQVTGASVVGGKYVYIRGLGERYASTQLNGAELPSADPDKKAFQMDILPSNLLDNIITKKTFTPDEPGNFSGGIINIGTKSYPESFRLKFSSSVSYNSQANLNDGFLSYTGGSRDWLGMDDGTRSIPNLLAKPTVDIPSPIAARRDAGLARQLDRLSKSFNSNMSPQDRTASVNQSYSLSLGNQIGFLGRPLGYVASMSYLRNYSQYENGTVGRWQLSGNAAQVNALDYDILLSDQKGKEEVLWGGLGTLSYKPHPNHKIGANYIHSQSGESVSRYQSGQWPDQLAEGPVYETRSLLYTERSLNSYQLNGEHIFPAWQKANLEWNAAISKSLQNEPDLRFFSDDYRIESAGGQVDTLYSINNILYNYPTRFFRDLNEKNANANVSLTMPFTFRGAQGGKLKLGGSVIKIDRSFRERRFEIRQQLAEYDGDPSAFFGKSRTGIVDSTSGRYYFGNYVVDASSERNNYDGNQSVSAAFAMVELPVAKKLRLIGGLRYEETRMDVVSQDPSAPKGCLHNNDWLPSINLVYDVIDKINVRLAYGRTLARPTFREMAPYRTFEFIGDYLFAGNANLKRTLIDNFDLRWEWFVRPGEIYAVSGFYKRFQNPIERTIDIETNQITYQNVDKGEVVGAEFEVRKQLDVVHSALKNFHLRSNFSIVRSQVNIAAAELELMRRFDPSANGTRPLYGQSPYILNLELSYQNSKSGTTTSLYTNILGKRLSEVTLGATPDVYERPQSLLDLTVTQKIWHGVDLKVAAKNLLDSSVRETLEFKGKEYIYHEYNLGRIFSAGLSYGL